MAELFSNFGEITWQMVVVMWLIGALLIYLAIKKGYGAGAAAADGLRRDSGQYPLCRVQ